MTTEGTTGGEGTGSSAGHAGQGTRSGRLLRTARPVDRDVSMACPGPAAAGVHRGLRGSRREDELPARMGQGEQKDIGGAVGAQVVLDGEDLGGVLRPPGVETLQEVGPVGDGAAGIGRGERLAGGQAESAEAGARASPAIIGLLLRPLGSAGLTAVRGCCRARTRSWPGKRLAASGPLCSRPTTTLLAGGDR